MSDARRSVTRPLQRAFRETRRRLMSPLGIDPSFVIIGAQKCGTTSLYRYLSSHPQIGSARTKEVHFFSAEFERGAAWYRSQFPHAIRRALRARTQGRRFVAGEASPDYLFDPRAPARLQAHLPDARLVVLLRDPVARAYSHYKHSVRRGSEPLSFEEAIGREPHRLEDAAPGSESFLHHSYAARGRYAEQLERWFACFDPAQFLIIESESFFGNTGAEYDRVLEHLGVGPHRPASFDRHNFHGVTDGPDAETLERLRERFAEPNRRLGELLGRSFKWNDAALGAASS